MKKRFASLLSIMLLVAVCTVFVAISPAQITTARFYGIVSDPSKAVIPGVTVRFIHEATGTDYVRKTDTAGEFMFDALRVGTYRLQIEAQGFRPLEAPGIVLESGQSVRRSFILELGSVAETVNVSASQLEVNTVSTEQRQSFTTIQSSELPLARRDYGNLLGIGTGVNVSVQGVRLDGLGKSGAKISVDGTQASGNAENAYTSLFGSFNYINTLSIEAIAEVQVIKGVASAEYGQQISGNVNLLTKSGTNSWRGSLFENFQAEELAARPQFLRSKAPLIFNQFGGSLGGPIKRDKIFIFGAYEGYRERRSSVVSGDVPTQKLRDEMLAAVPAYKVALDVMPLPNLPHAATADVGRWEGADGSEARENHVTVKGDLQLSSSSSVALTYARMRPYSTSPNFRTTNRNFFGYMERGTVSYITAGPRWTSESRFGYNWNEVDRFDSYFFDSIDTSQPEQTYGGRRFPGIQADGLFTTGDAELNNRFGPQVSLEEKFSVHLAKHSLKFGAMLTRRGSGRVNMESPQVQYGNRAALLANVPSRVQVFLGQPPFKGWNNDIGFFFQDDWRVNSKLVLNLGVRYDFFGRYVATPESPTDTAGFFNWDGLLDSKFNFGPVRDPSNPVENDALLNIGPRLGFAYNPDGKANLVIRGGVGVSFGTQPTDDYNSAVSRTAALSRSVSYSAAEAATLGLRYPVFTDAVMPLYTSSDQRVKEIVFDPSIQNPYGINMYLGIQRSISQSLMVETAFVGTRGVKYRMRRQYNEVDRITGARPNPGVGTGQYMDGSQTTSYFSWQSSLRKRLSRGLTGSAHYTWGKALSPTGGDTGATFSGDTIEAIQDFFDIRSARGPSTGDVTHRFIAEFIYELPAFGSLRTARKILGGWQTSGVFDVRTGTAFNITQSCSLRFCKPDYIGGNATLSDYRQTLQYINNAAFARVPVVAASGATAWPGNIGNGAVRLPSAWNLNFSLARRFSITESMAFQIRADAFNFFNHTNFSGLQSNINSSAFGRFTNTSGARNVQLGARLTF